jgi:hypothetical protein
MVEEYELVANMFEVATEKTNFIIKEKIDKTIEIIEFFSEKGLISNNSACELLMALIWHIEKK